MAILLRNCLAPRGCLTSFPACSLCRSAASQRAAFNRLRPQAVLSYKAVDGTHGYTHTMNQPISTLLSALNMMILPYPLTTADRVEIHELPGRYGDAIDDRDWTRLDSIFIRFGVNIGHHVRTGVSGFNSIKALMSSSPLQMREPTPVRSNTAS